MISICLQAWEIYIILHIVIKDNGSNIVAGAGIVNPPCLSHTLQLVIKDGCLAQPCLSNETATTKIQI